MKISANLHFSQMENQNFGKILLSSVDRCVGKNAFEVLAIHDGEKSFLIKNLLRGSSPVAILSSTHVILVNRGMLYSHGLCCFCELNTSLHDTCALFSQGIFEECIISDGVKSLGKSHQTQNPDIYIKVSRLLSFLSILDDRASVSIPDTARAMSECFGCKLQYLSLDGEIFPDRMGIIYSNATFCLACLSLLLGTHSAELCLCVRSYGENIQMTIDRPNVAQAQELLNYLKYISELRDMSFDFYLTDTQIRLELCPFYADIGLVGVKNYLKFNFDFNGKDTLWLITEGEE